MADLREKQSHLIFVFLLIAIQAGLIDSELSDYVTICSARDPKLNECFKNSAMEMIYNMTNGIPELGIPKIDPFRISNAFSAQPDNRLMLTLSDPIVYDLSKAVVTDARADPEKFNFYLNLHLQKQQITGTYKIKGKIYIMPIHGNGQMNVTLTEVNIVIRFSGKPEIRNDVLYMKLINISTSLDPKKARIQLDNLFNGNKMLGTIMNDVMNNSWRDMYHHLKPKLEQLFGDEMFMFLNNFLSRTPYNQIFNDLNN